MKVLWKCEEQTIRVTSFYTRKAFHSDSAVTAVDEFNSSSALTAVDELGNRMAFKSGSAVIKVDELGNCGDSW